MDVEDILPYFRRSRVIAHRDGLVNETMVASIIDELAIVIFLYMLGVIRFVRRQNIHIGNQYAVFIIQDTRIEQTDELRRKTG